VSDAPPRASVVLRNLPLPEGQLALLALGLALQWLRPLRLPIPTRAAAFGSGVGIAASAASILWATRAAGDVDLAEPDRLVTTGPYALTRHPMYEAWTALYAAIALGLRNGWLAAFLPLVVAFVHRDTGREDARLRRRFGPDHDAYARVVPRYLTIRLVRLFRGSSRARLSRASGAQGLA
jgi:protein-S-isoprenylcysteine O-methyltransferase Ste14